MRNRSISVVFAAGLVAVAVAACGGSEKASGTNQQSYTAGTGTVGTTPTGPSAGGSGASTAAGSTGASTGGSSTAASGGSTAAGGGSTAAAFGDAAKGKTLFTTTCGACHTLKDAGTKGQVGPDLDQSTIAKDPQMVYDQITKNAVPPMPLNLYKGQDAKDVGAYVASVSGK